MTEEQKEKYSAFVTEISEILGLGKPVDIIKLCVATDHFFKPLQNQIKELQEENERLKKESEENQDLATIAYMQGMSKNKAKLDKAKELLKELNEGLDRLYLSGLSDKQIAFVEKLQAKAEAFLKE